MGNWCARNRRFLLELPQDDLIWEQERKVVSAEERMQKGKVTWLI